jgi:hypothetical protein
LRTPCRPGCLRWCLVPQSSPALNVVAHMLSSAYVRDRHPTTMSLGGQRWAVSGCAPMQAKVWHCAASAPALGGPAQLLFVEHALGVGCCPTLCCHTKCPARLLGRAPHVGIVHLSAAQRLHWAL